jgi:glucosamine-6-phosphate deaminase
LQIEIEHLQKGEANSPEIQKLKGEIREFEEELVWAYAGTSLTHIHHLRLGLYNDGSQGQWQGPDYERDVLPILSQLRELKPTTITVAIDSEGQGPNTHYKVMQSIAEAIRQWNEEEDLAQLRIIGYRNVWSIFHPAEANMYVPVSLNAFAVFEKAFKDSYLTQFKAEFPNPDFNGPFSELAEQIWVKQYKDIQLVLGKNYFYENAHPLIRATHGLLFLKEMRVKEFLAFAEEMKEKINRM